MQGNDSHKQAIAWNKLLEHKNQLSPSEIQACTNEIFGYYGTYCLDQKLKTKVLLDLESILSGRIGSPDAKQSNMGESIKLYIKFLVQAESSPCMSTPSDVFEIIISYYAKHKINKIHDWAIVDDLIKFNQFLDITNFKEQKKAYIY